MTPLPIKLQSTTMLTIMPSPNTKALAMTARNGSCSGMRAVHIGKEAQPVTLPTIVTVN